MYVWQHLLRPFITSQVIIFMNNQNLPWPNHNKFQLQLLAPSQQHFRPLIMRWLKPSTHTLRKKKEKCLLVSISIYNKINKSKNQVKIYLSFKKKSNNNKLFLSYSLKKKAWKIHTQFSLASFDNKGVGITIVIGFHQCVDVCNKEENYRFFVSVLLCAAKWKVMKIIGFSSVVFISEFCHLLFKWFHFHHPSESSSFHGISVMSVGKVKFLLEFLLILIIMVTNVSKSINLSAMIRRFALGTCNAKLNGAVEVFH